MGVLVKHSVHVLFSQPARNVDASFSQKAIDFLLLILDKSFQKKSTSVLYKNRLKKGKSDGTFHRVCPWRQRWHGEINKLVSQFLQKGNGAATLEEGEVLLCFSPFSGLSFC